MSLYSTTILADSPITYYRMAEQAFQAADAASKGADGVYHTAGITYQQTSLVGDSGDKAIKLDGSSGRVFLPLFNLPTGNNAWTIEAWVNINSLPSAGNSYVIASFGNWNNTKQNAFINVDSSGHFGAGSFGGDIAETTSRTAGTTHHVVATWDGTTMTLYVDGSSVQTGTPGSLTVTPKAARIGADPVDGHLFNGTIDEVAIYNTALSSSRVSAHHSGTGSGYSAIILGESSLIAYYRLGESAPSTGNLTDSSGNSHAGSYTAGIGRTKGLLTGDTDTAMQFVGVSGASGATTGLPTGNAAWSVEAWFTVASLNALGVNGAIFAGFGTWNTKQCGYIGVDSTGHLECGVFGTDYKDTNVVTFNTRHHIVGTYDGTTIKLYKDGSQIASGTPGALTVGTTAFKLGDNVAGGGTNLLYGTLDEVAIYGVALSSTQVTTHYNAGANPTNNLTLSGNVVEAETISAQIQGITLAKPLPQYALWVRDNATLQYVDTLNDFQALQASLIFNGVSSLVVGLDPQSAHLVNCLPDGSGNYPLGLVLTRDNQDGNGPQLLFSGPIVDLGVDFDMTANPPYSFIVTANSDDIALQDRDCLPVLTFPVYATTVLADSPLRYYRLGEPSGTTATDSASGAHAGTYHGGVTLAQTPGIDDPDTCALFDGSSGYMSAASSGLPTSANAPVTLHCWCYLASNPASTRFLMCVGDRDTGGAVLALELLSSGVAQLSTASVAVNSSAALALNTWHHLAGVFDGSKLFLYVDGVLQNANGTAASLTLAYSGATPFAIASQTSGSLGAVPGGFFAGDIDEAVMVGSALSAARILSIYQVGVTRFGLSAYDTRTGVVSTIMQQFVQYNAGSLALAERQNALLQLAGDPALGGTVTEPVRFNTLLEVLQDLSIRATNELGFIIRQTMNASNNHLLLTIFAPRNQTSQAIFSTELHNLAKYSYNYAAPVANVAYVGGSGQGTARLFAPPASDAGSISRWRRVEKFYNDSNLTTIADLKNQAEAHLSTDIDHATLGFEAVDTESCVFLRDYQLGDLVTVRVDLPNQTTIIAQDVIRQVLIDLKQGGYGVVQPVIGGPGALHPLTFNKALRRQISRAQKQVTQLQNNQ